MRKKKSINCPSKKILIKGVATTLVVLLPFSIIKSKKVNAIVGVDDAILFSVIGLGAITSVSAVYGIEKSGIIEKAGEVLGDNLQSIGNGWKTIENGTAIAKSTVTYLDDIVSCLNSLEGTTYLEYVDTSLDAEGYNVIYIPLKSNFIFSIPRSRMVVKWGGGNFSTEQSLDFTPTNSEFRTYYTYDSRYSRDHQYLTNDSNFSVDFSRNDGTVWNAQPYFRYKLIDGITTPVKISSEGVVPSIHDVTNEPTSISLDKSFVDGVAATYAEQNPNDNNGDKNVDYATLIPLFFDMLEKKLGDGTITPTNLSNVGVSSYVYEDGTVQGKNPYNFQALGDNNINVEQNVNIGNEISEEEKDGILNILDNGFRKTTTMLNNLKNSIVGLGDTIRGLFDFLPEPVEYLFYSLICLSLVFSILSLRR